MTDILVDFVDVLGTDPAGDTYADWLVASYGRTFAETFPHGLRPQVPHDRHAER